jgi:hypothetical protein
MAIDKIQYIDRRGINVTNERQDATKINEIIDAVNDLQDGDITTSSITPDGGLLTVTGDELVTGDFTVSGDTDLTGGLTIGGKFRTTSTTNRSGAGAISLSYQRTRLTTTAADALTLAAGSDGQEITVMMVSDGGDGTLTPTDRLGFASITFTAVGQTVTLIGTTNSGGAFAWAIKSYYGVTIA